MAHESNIIAALIELPASRSEIFERVKPEDFLSFDNGNAFEKLKGINEADPKALDQPRQRLALRRNPEFAVHIAARDQQHYLDAIDILISESFRARVRCAATEISKLADSPTVTDVELKTSLSRITADTDDSRIGHDQRTAAELVQAVVESAERAAAGISNPCVTWGWPELDAVCPLEVPSYTIIAARPTVGKTALACSAMINQLAAGVPVGIIGLEMTAEQYMRRFLSIMSRCSYGKIRDGVPITHRSQEFMDAAEWLSKAPLHIPEHVGRMNEMDFKGSCRALVRDHGCKVIYLDYIQLMGSSRPNASKFERVSEVSSQIMAMKGELDCAFVILAQINRESGSGVPKMNHLRDCGDLEQDAENIVLLDRPDVFLPEIVPRNYTRRGGAMDMTRKAALIVAKNRNGSRGTLFLDFVKELAQFKVNDG